MKRRQLENIGLSLIIPIALFLIMGLTINEINPLKWVYELKVLVGIASLFGFIVNYLVMNQIDKRNGK